MKIIKFVDGTYGVRKLAINPFAFGWVYHSMSGDAWYSKDSHRYHLCKLDLEKAVEIYNRYKDSGTPITMNDINIED